MNPALEDLAVQEPVHVTVFVVRAGQMKQTEFPMVLAAKISQIHRVTGGLRLESSSGDYPVPGPAQAGLPGASCPGPGLDGF